MRRTPLTLAVAGAVLLGLAAASSAVAAEEGEGGPPPNPAKVAVPFEGEFEVRMADGWLIQDCASVPPPPQMEFTCEPSQITLEAPDYDPEYETVNMVVAASNGALTEDFVYRVSMAAPTIPAGVAFDLGVPAPSGSRILIPHADLAVACEGCSGESAPIEVVGVAPTEAGIAFATATHLALAITPGHVGPIDVGYRVQDAHEQWSEPTAVRIDARAVGESTLVAMHTIIVREGASQTIDLRRLVFSSSGAAFEILDCGAPAWGTIDCAGTTATYTATEGAHPVDQFSFTAYAFDGEFANGSVTIVDAESELAGAAAGGSTTRADSIVIAAPPESEETEVGVVGFFTPLSVVVDRVTGRK